MGMSLSGKNSGINLVRLSTMVPSALLVKWIICTHCGRLNHRRSLYPKLYGNGDGNYTASSEGRVDNTETQTVSDVVDDEKTMLTSTNQVLMQTAISTIRNTSGEKSLKVCMILDSRSQRTYVTERLAKDLCLSLSPPEKLAVVTFGTEKPWHLQYKPSLLELVFKDGKVMHLGVSVVPSITGKINRVPLKAQHLEFLKNKFGQNMLADSLP